MIMTVENGVDTANTFFFWSFMGSRSRKEIALKLGSRMEANSTTYNSPSSAPPPEVTVGYAC